MSWAWAGSDGLAPRTARMRVACERMGVPQDSQLSEQVTQWQPPLQARPSMAAIRPDLIEREHDLRDDQQCDNDLDPLRMLSIDQIRQRLRGLGNDGKLAIKRVGAPFQLILVLQARIEPLQIMPVPQHIRLLLRCNPAREPVLQL